MSRSSSNLQLNELGISLESSDPSSSSSHLKRGRGHHGEKMKVTDDLKEECKSIIKKMSHVDFHKLSGIAVEMEKKSLEKDALSHLQMNESVFQRFFKKHKLPRYTVWRKNPALLQIITEEKRQRDNQPDSFQSQVTKIISGMEKTDYQMFLKAFEQAKVKTNAQDIIKNKIISKHYLTTIFQNYFTFKDCSIVYDDLKISTLFHDLINQAITARENPTADESLSSEQGTKRSAASLFQNDSILFPPSKTQKKSAFSTPSSFLSSEKKDWPFEPLRSAQEDDDSLNLDDFDTLYSSDPTTQPIYAVSVPLPPQTTQTETLPDDNNTNDFEWSFGPQ